MPSFGVKPFETRRARASFFSIRIFFYLRLTLSKRESKGWNTRLVFSEINKYRSINCAWTRLNSVLLNHISWLNLLVCLVQLAKVGDSVIRLQISFVRSFCSLISFASSSVLVLGHEGEFPQSHRDLTDPHTYGARSCPFLITAQVRRGNITHTPRRRWLVWELIAHGELVGSSYPIYLQDRSI